MLAANRLTTLTRHYARTAVRPVSRAPNDIGICNAWVDAVPSVELWVDYRDVTTAPGADLTTWAAKSGASPTQSTSSKRPEIASDGSVQFDAVGEALEAATLDLSGTATATIAVAVKRNSAGVSQALFHYGGAASWNTDGFLIGFTSGDKWWFNLAEDSPVAQKRDYSSDDAPLGEWVSMSMVMNRDASGADQLKAYDKDGVVSVTVDSAGSVTGNFAAAGNAWIGSENNGGIYPADSDIQEIVVVGDNLSAADAQALARILAFKSRSL